MDSVEWSSWMPFADAVAAAPRTLGVYMAREGEHGAVIYIGMAGERKGSGTGKGIHGRLKVYASGKGLASGLGEAVFDRALADADWLSERLAELETTGPRRAKHWGVEAFVRADLHIRWTQTSDRASAAALEDRLVREAGGALWNKASVRAAAYAALVAEAASHRALVGELDVPLATDVVSQPVTENDLRANQVRIPLRFRELFPAEKQAALTVVLRGEVFTCSWDPRVGPDRVRSGLLRFPSGVLASRLTPDLRLSVSLLPDSIELT